MLKSEIRNCYRFVHVHELTDIAINLSLISVSVPFADNTTQ